jgi:hypothetical protein
MPEPLRNVGTKPETCAKVRIAWTISHFRPEIALFPGLTWIRIGSERREPIARQAHIEGVYLRAVAEDDPPPSKEQVDAAWKSVERAVGRVRQSLPPNEPCVFCGGAITVEGLPPSGPYTSWIFGCPCGKTSGSLKGL